MLYPCLDWMQRQIMGRFPHLLHALTWTALLASMVSVASFSSEMAFVSAISPSSCNLQGLVSIPLDFPRDKICLPAHMLKRSKVDFFVPTVFAGIVVAASACVLRSLALWDNE
ncbi:putative Cytochrome P450 [Hibiscus syriacus]|uniref:Cytochrome P450 n=1 Tax=Hibiscus syriacus TaxID=106335 RepID=A0A6A3D2X1_HIBSY|nr:putative Cytochrome P450 [Hibiscus syriacus]